MKSIAEMRACSMTDIELAMMFRQGDDRDKRIARCELAGRGYQTYAGISLRDPENGNGKVAPEEVKRVRLERDRIKEFNAQEMADGLAGMISPAVRNAVSRAKEEIKMSNQQRRSNEQIKHIKQDMKKMSDDQLRSIFIRGDDRQLSALARAELLARPYLSSVYEVTLLTSAMGGNVTSSRLKRTISSEYVESLLDVCDEVRIRKVEIE